MSTGWVEDEPTTRIEGDGWGVFAKNGEFIAVASSKRWADYWTALEAAAEALADVLPLSWFGCSPANSDGIMNTIERCEKAKDALAHLRELREGKTA